MYLHSLLAQSAVISHYFLVRACNLRYRCACVMLSLGLMENPDSVFFCLLVSDSNYNLVPD